MSDVLNLGEIVAAHARLQPGAIGACDSRRTLTFAQWNSRACRLANALAGLGLGKGDRVALLAHNRVEWMEIYVALAKAGLVAVPINFRLVAPEIRYIVEHCDARAFIVEDELADRVEALRGELGIAAGGWIRLGDSTPKGWTGYEALLAGAAGRGARRGSAVDRHVGADVHVGHDRQAQGRDPQSSGQRSDLARHGARHGPHAR